LKESAQDLVAKVVPKPSRAEKLLALRAGMKWANERGITRVDSAGGDFEVLDLFDEMLRRGDLSVRLYIAYFLNPPQLRPQDLKAIEQARKKFHDDWIDASAVKFMVDGVIESHTAAMLEPYSDDPSLKGKLFWEPANYNSAVAELDKRGLQLFTHAIGDYGVRTALDAYENAEARNHTDDRRPRIEHIETITQADIPRFGKLGVIASMQPLHSYPDADTLDVWARNAGPDRASRAWVWKTIADAGGRLAFGSDWPVVTLDPWQGVQTAVTRQTLEGKPEAGFVPKQRLTVAQAIDGYTLGAAFAGRREKTEGSLEIGKLADLIILSQNIFDIDPHKIAAIGNLHDAPRSRTIDARGQVVAPGFIDMLGQSEYTILVDPRVPSKIYQGITTEITGEGESIAPLNDAILKADQEQYDHYRIHVDWRTFREYFSRLEKQHTGINIASYVGATRVRRMVLGDND